MTISAFPKIFAIGTDYIRDLFEGPVEVTEKVDGSQFVFGRTDEGEFVMRSKGRVIYEESVDKMFAPAVEAALGRASAIDNGQVLYCEYLRAPKHNTLRYERTPLGHLMLFGASWDHGTRFAGWADLEHIAWDLDIDVAPLLHEGEVASVSELVGYLERESYLGGTTIEGVVVKNYAQPFLLGGQPIPLMCGKFVSEAFKEKHLAGWSKEHTARGKWDVFRDGFRTEARWEKAVQHLRDDGRLENAPRDIGPLIKEIQRDITEEEIDTIKDFLWREFGSTLLRTATAGVPEWYKRRLAERSFEEDE